MVNISISIISIISIIISIIIIIYKSLKCVQVLPDKESNACIKKVKINL